jgi:hypothetical protein
VRVELLLYLRDRLLLDLRIRSLTTLILATRANSSRSSDSLSDMSKNFKKNVQVKRRPDTMLPFRIKQL